MKQIFYFLLLLSLVSCKESETVPNKFIGKWFDTEYIVPMKASIEIKSDSTFSYSSSSCQWKSLSKGSWKISKDTIELTSSKIDTCYRAFPFMHCLKFGQEVQTVMRIKGCEPEYNDTNFAIFKNEKFYLKNDSLIYVYRKDWECSDSIIIKYARTGKIKNGS